uniref:Fibronectin type-III domain-containing protein n=1 Tax=Amblyomma maculatum TaxID=34609 RepID=G3MQV9_AMBMU
MKPWTNYTVLVRPFYTESGKPQPMYKIGTAAKVVFQTLSSEPDIPGLVSVLSAQQGNVVLNVVGPSAWNCYPVGFHVRWEAPNVRHGQQGELDVALASEWSVEENMVNVTLPLKGGADYRVFVSAVGADDSGGRRQGPEADVEVSVALDSYEVSAYAVGSFRCLVSWRSSEIVDDFRVTIYKDDGLGNQSLHIMRQIKRNGKITKKYSILISDLLPWTYYVVGLEGCSAGNCSDPVNATFSTPPEVLPAPSFTEVKATGSSSFEVIWRFAQRDPRLFDGFRVRYCANALDSCFLVYTNQTILTVDGLSPQTFVKVYVAAEYRDIKGKLQRGPEAETYVTTWTDVPVVQVEFEGNVEDGAETSLLSWRCVNCIVDYFQYQLSEYGVWTTCNDDSECDVFKEGDEMSASGYLRLEIQEQVTTLKILVRGCNSFGCGEASPVHVNVRTAGPARLLGVTLSSKGTEAELRWLPPGNEYNGVDVTWNCSNNDTITYNKWFLREAERREHDYMWHHREPQNKHSAEALITDLPTSADQCDFYVSACNDYGESRYCSSPVKADHDVSLRPPNKWLS